MVHFYHRLVFEKVAQYPHPPVERIFFATLSQNPRNNGDPAPNEYNLNVKSAPPVRDHPPFLSSAERFDRRANKFFTGNTVSTGIVVHKMHVCGLVLF